MTNIFLKYYHILIVAFLITFSLKSYSSDTTLTNVKLQLKWKHQFQFAGYYAAIEKGYYRDLGIKVELIEANDKELPGEAVLNGKADFGISTSDIVLMRADGKPVVILATIFQHSAQILLASKRSGIKYVHNLGGKKIMIEPHAADIIAYLNDEGISLNQIEQLPHSFDVNMLVENKVDAMTAYSTDEPFVLKNQDIDYIIFTPISGGIDFYGDILITSEQLLLESPMLAKNFRSASLKGWKYAMDNPNEIVELIYNKYSKRHSIQHLAFEAEKMNEIIVPDVIEIGYSNPGRWQRIIEIYKQTGILKTDVSLNGLLYTDYLKKPLIIPWMMITIFILVILFLSSIAIFFYRISKKLKIEVQYRKQIHTTLVENEKKLFQSNATKDKFFSIIAHDLKNPFTTILGFSRLLVDNFDNYNNEKKIEYISLIQQATKNTYNLLENLLLWSRNQQGYINFNPAQENLYLLIIDTFNLLIQSAKSKSISLRNEAPKDLNVYVDRNMLSTILRNLISNSIKFTPRNGEIKVSVQSIVNKNNQSLTKIIVSDNGIGIELNAIKKIFNIAENYSTKGTENEKGSGLGLIICKDFVAKHNGNIWIESKKGEGSKFIFTIPNTRE